MDANEIDVLVQRLLTNPHDQEALAYAHTAGGHDPESYAYLLEKIGTESTDPVYACHWLTEAGNVWLTTLGDAHRAARVYMLAVDRDPTHEVAAERLADLYREKGEVRALVALLERRVKALSAMPATRELQGYLAGVHEELGRLWSDPPLSSPRKALENYRRAIELDSTSAFAIYGARELYKRAEQWEDALLLFDPEQALIDDPVRKVALYRDEAQVRRAAGDPRGASAALRAARLVNNQDAGLAQELGASIVERMTAGDVLDSDEQKEAAELFISLAENYDGELGFAYAIAALDLQPGHDRAMQLASHHAADLGREADLISRWESYVKLNPAGALAEKARGHLESEMEPAEAERRPPLQTQPDAPKSHGAVSESSFKVDRATQPDDVGAIDALRELSSMDSSKVPSAEGGSAAAHVPSQVADVATDTDLRAPDVGSGETAGFDRHEEEESGELDVQDVSPDEVEDVEDEDDEVHEHHEEELHAAPSAASHPGGSSGFDSQTVTVVGSPEDLGIRQAKEKSAQPSFFDLGDALRAEVLKEDSAEPGSASSRGPETAASAVEPEATAPRTEERADLLLAPALAPGALSSAGDAMETPVTEHSHSAVNDEASVNHRASMDAEEGAHPEAPDDSPIAAPAARPTSHSPNPSSPPSQGRDSARLRASGSGESELNRLLSEAASLASRGQRPQALIRYRRALEIQPYDLESLRWVEDYLRQKRQFADLRDVWLGILERPVTDPATHTRILGDVAQLAETQLRDAETALSAYHKLWELHPEDADPPEQLRRLYERLGRWEELARVHQREAELASDKDAKVAAEKKCATVHEVKRKDVVEAAEAWLRIAQVSDDSMAAVTTALGLFDRAATPEAAADAIVDWLDVVQEKEPRLALFQQLSRIRERSGDFAGAGEALWHAALLESRAEIWEGAERCLTAAEQWQSAASLLLARGEATGEERSRAEILARAAGYFLRVGLLSEALGCLEHASALVPESDGYAASLEEQYARQGQSERVVDFLLTRAEKLSEPEARAAQRKRAAQLQETELSRLDDARATRLLVLEDAEDPEVLLWLANDAETRGDQEAAYEYVSRLLDIATEQDDRTRLALRSAALSESLGNDERALERYSSILETLDKGSVLAAQSLVRLREKRAEPRLLAAALEVLLSLTEESENKLDIARRLTTVYEALADRRGELRARTLVHELDAEDLESVSRLELLAEELEDWDLVSDLLAELIEVEGDDEELSLMSRKRADVLAQRTDRKDEALRCLEGPADAGDSACQDAYVKLGDELGIADEVAAKLVQWHPPSPRDPHRVEALRGAFIRYLTAGLDEEAAKVAVDLVRMKGADREIGEQLERIAVRLRNIDALAAAHDVLAHYAEGDQRPTELVRQAEVLVSAGVDPNVALQRGEVGLAHLSPADAEPLLAKLALLAPSNSGVVDLYERQIARSAAQSEKLEALGRAAQVACERDALPRARALFDAALAVSSHEETLVALELAARAGDVARGGTLLRSLLVDALTAAGHDGDRVPLGRNILLRRAEHLAEYELGDFERAFHLITEALKCHVDSPTLEVLKDLAHSVRSPIREESVLTQVLASVEDAPLLRQLLGRRAALRRDALGDAKGAASDYKRLHDLSPTDVAISDQLSSLLLSLGDYPAMVHLLEDQILRSKEVHNKADLARRVAAIWEGELADPVEAADAWRRVLRIRPGDPEGQAGLDRAKANMLVKKSKVAATLPEEEPQADSSPLLGAEAGREPNWGQPSERTVEDQRILSEAERSDDGHPGASAEGVVHSEDRNPEALAEDGVRPEVAIRLDDVLLSDRAVEESLTRAASDEIGNDAESSEHAPSPEAGNAEPSEDLLGAADDDEISVDDVDLLDGGEGSEGDEGADQRAHDA